MRDLKITNPDTPVMDVCIEMAVPKNPGASGATDTGEPRIKRPLLPILLATKPYAGGIFFGYLEWWFMVITQTSSGTWVPLITDGKPVLYESASLLSQYKELIGYNLRGELFHPDEILAQNFVFVANLPSQELLLNIQKKLRQR